MALLQVNHNMRRHHEQIAACQRAHLLRACGRCHDDSCGAALALVGMNRSHKVAASSIGRFVAVLRRGQNAAGIGTSAALPTQRRCVDIWVSSVPGGQLTAPDMNDASTCIDPGDALREAVHSGEKHIDASSLELLRGRKALVCGGNADKRVTRLEASSRACRTQRLGPCHHGFGVMRQARIKLHGDTGCSRKVCLCLRGQCGRDVIHQVVRGARCLALRRRHSS